MKDALKNIIAGALFIGVPVAFLALWPDAMLITGFVATVLFIFWAIGCWIRTPSKYTQAP